MRKQSIQRPPYPITSVDNALRIVQILRDQGSVRLTDVAAELGIAVSTAHRLMAMLVYRGFAIQDDSKRYAPGPALGARALNTSWNREIRQVLQPLLEELCVRFDETTNLVVRVGAHVRFLHSVEAHSVLRVGDRAGTVLPARTTSGGKALLCHENTDYLARLYLGKGSLTAGHALDRGQFDTLLGELDAVRDQGYAVNREESEGGIGAIGMAILGPDDRPLAAYSVATPIVRLDRLLHPSALEQLFDARQEMAAALHGAGLDQPEPG
jgi:IclR family transcriptional regulator, acetate operon repressor